MGRGASGCAVSPSGLLYGLPGARANGRVIDADELHLLDGGEILDGDGDYQTRTLNGKLHCDYGPAITFATGKKMWFKDGAPHREDGPAVEGVDDPDEYWIDGLQVVAPKPGHLPSLPEPLNIEARLARAAGQKPAFCVLAIPSTPHSLDFDSAKRNLETLKSNGHYAVMVGLDSNGQETFMDDKSLRQGQVLVGGTEYRVYTADKLKRRR